MAMCRDHGTTYVCHRRELERPLFHFFNLASNLNTPFFRLLHLHYNFLLLGLVHSIKHRIRQDVKKNTTRDCIAFCAAIADY